MATRRGHRISHMQGKGTLAWRSGNRSGCTRPYIVRRRPVRRSSYAGYEPQRESEILCLILSSRIRWRAASADLSVVSYLGHRPPHHGAARNVRSAEPCSSLARVAAAYSAYLLIFLLERTLRLVLCWLIFGLVIAFAYGAYEIAAGLCKILLGGRESAADAFCDARLRLTCTRRMPWRMLQFLMEADRLGILRQRGATYQFRHIRLQRQLALRYVPPARRVATAVMPCLRLWMRHVHWQRTLNWRPRSVAPWTLPLWTVLLRDDGDIARTTWIKDAPGAPDGQACQQGPGVLQRFIGNDADPPWVLCALPGRGSSFVAGPVWQALHNSDEQAVRTTGREQSASTLTAIGFPLDPVVSPDATRVSLAAGTLSDGT